MVIEPTGKAVLGLKNKQLVRMQRVNFCSMWGPVRLRRDTSMCELPGSRLSVVGL